MPTTKITYVVNHDASALAGWTPETLAAALAEPLRRLGVVVVCEPGTSGLGGLSDEADDGLAELVARVVERVICAGEPA